MKTRAWFRYFLTKAISQRKGRFLLSSAAVALAVAVVSALLTLSLGIREKIGGELTQYGANMIVTGRSGEEISQAVADALRSVFPGIRDASFQVYGTARMGQRDVEIIGIEPGRMQGYRIYGEYPRTDDDLMVGVNLKDALRTAPGSSMVFDRTREPFKVAAVFERGSDEDSAVILRLDAARRLLGLQGVSAVLLNADAGQLTAVEHAIEERFPGLEVKTLRQVAVAEERILQRIQLLMLLVTGVVLAASAVALGSTMNANVIERLQEIGLMKAIGATAADIRSFFMMEASLAGLSGSAAGYGLGLAAAELVSQTAFGSFVRPQLLAVPGAFVLGITIAVLATALPVRNAMKVSPSAILRGE